MNANVEATDMALLEQVEAQQALHQLNAKFSRALDRMDRALLVSLLSDDAQIDCGAHKGPAAAFVTAVTSADPALERSFHSISNEYFQVDGDQAVGEVYVINISTIVEAGQKLDRLIGGRYLDRYQRTHGQWQVTQRVFVHDWNMTRPSTAVWDEGLFGQFKLRGTRDTRDPVYELLGA